APNAMTALGTANDTSTSTTLASPSATVAAGNTIFVAVAMDTNASSVSVTDAAGNTYSKDADITNRVSLGVRSLLFSAPVTNALSGSITITFSTIANINKAASFFAFADLVSPPTDRSHAAT